MGGPRDKTSNEKDKISENSRRKLKQNIQVDFKISKIYNI